ncbi:hypothetical protein ACQPZX_45300 [Actinoplanes sp. CA-142083]|uniref:hypothetical protein n=1 Tax=Actinoplanes sp. CA-142083 TaxID=3239903 RepID=UPI003D8B72DE
MSDPVLTSSWCTNWGAYNTPRLWSMVMNEDDAPGRQQVSAWRTLAGSVRSQRTALLTARAELVAAWPPEENESSAAFVAELDILIARLDSASADADSTASGLDNILTAIQTAKTTIQPLWEKYKDKSTDLVPHWWDKAEDEIDDQARQAMISAERAVEDSVALLKVPDAYKPFADRIDEPGSGEDNGSLSQTTSTSSSRGISASVRHDPVPPLPGQNPTIPDGGGQASSDIGGSGGVGGVGGGAAGAGTVVGGGGPDLAGVITPPGGTPIVPGGDATGIPGGGGVGTPLPPVGGVGGGGAVGPAVPGLLPTGGGVPIGQTGRAPRGSSGRLTRPAKSGGVIGEPPAGGAGRSGAGPIGAAGGIGAVGGRGGAGSRAGRTGRVGAGGSSLEEPGRGVRGGVGISSEGLGGVRGGRGSAAGRGANRQPRPSWLPDDPVGPNRNTGVVAGAPGRAGRHRSGEDDGYGFDPDNPWEVAEGVDPVIAPSTDNPRHDPGPNVIGWR